MTLVTSLLVAQGCGTSDGNTTPANATISIADANNYHSVSTLTIPQVETAAGQELTLDFTQFTNDIQCHAVAPQDDVDNVVLLRFANTTHDDIATKLESNQLRTSDVDQYNFFNTDHTSSTVLLSQLGFFGTPMIPADTYIESTEYTYLLLLAEGTTPGLGTRSMTFLNPSSASTNTTATIASGCGVLDFQADISSKPPVSAPLGGAWVVDWSGVSVDSTGVLVPLQDIDGLLLGYYEGLTTTELEAQIFNIESIATNIYELTLTGATTADLANARERGADGSLGANFSGFAGKTSGVWLLALTCSRCQNPAPLVLTVLQPQ